MFYPETSRQPSLRGLTQQEAEARLREHGPNALPEKQPESFFSKLLRQFKSPIIYILLVALVVSLVVWWLEGRHGLPFEALAIALILAVNAGLGMYQEGKAEAALQKLKSLAAPHVWVRRDGQWRDLTVSELVPGDIVRLEAGDRVPADGVALEVKSLSVDESILTGESLPVEKNDDDELLSGSLAVRGRAYLHVTRTGAKSTMGRLATLLGDIKEEQTPVEKRLRVFGNRIARWIGALTVLLIVAGLFAEGLSRLDEVFIFAVALAVSAVPEGLPAVLTLTLALGMERMAKRKAVVRKMSSVEALGSVTVIATDKTGTLTENKMQVQDIDTSDKTLALMAMVHANDAEDSGTGDRGIGDPLELALLDYAREQGLEPATLREESPRVSSRPFDSAWKYMCVSVQENGETVSYLKGAPEVLLAKCSMNENERTAWQEKALARAREGYRVLGLAYRSGEAEEQLTFLGLVLIGDPPRPEVPGAIASAIGAGIRVVMVTGDHPATALAVAQKIGIPGERVITGDALKSLSDKEILERVREVNVFARVHPEQKLKLVETLQQSGEVVAMTGDGVNDAPALKRSDVGLAMGQRGSDVSREVADLVLLDDNFATIVAAIEEGRSIYENIQKFIRFLFSTNLALVLLVVGGATLSFIMGIRTEAGLLLLPLTAVQLLWINIIADGPPALALGLDRNPGVMKQRPRDPRSPLLDPDSLRFILLTGVFKAAIGIALLGVMPWLGYTILATQTVIFLYESIAQLAFAYPSRTVSVLPKTNALLNWIIVISIFVQLATVMIPGLRQLLGLEPLDLKAFVVMTASILLTWAVASWISQRARKSHDLERHTKNSRRRQAT
jgi:Ca2+-transporting ATPase